MYGVMRKGKKSMQAFETVKSTKWRGQFYKTGSESLPKRDSDSDGDDTAGKGLSDVSFLCPRCARTKRRDRKRAGFTLVEVIVVIVIIAILAAIGVPALTGYIDKARDRQYIAQARNIFVAVRAALDEAYANGEYDPNDKKYDPWGT
jgi:prepilin-type N-terminal cleavage/methylation domain-containing protein